MIRLAHFSDVHITAKPLGWRRRDWFTKRFPGWVNFRWLGREHRFRRAEAVLLALMKELRDWQPDRIVFSGDATALGFEPEFAQASAVLGLGNGDCPPGLAVPGNHDYYTNEVEASGLFERFFAPWQNGDRLDDAVYPFAQRVGPLWLVGVNSSTGNRWMWDASGRVRPGQLERLDRLLAKLEPGLRILVTHYPVRLASGKPERSSHALRNLNEVVAVACRRGVALWLHGHRHGAYFFHDPAVAPFPIVCAGSATQTGLWSYNQYTLDGLSCRTVRRVFDPASGRFADGQNFDFSIPDRMR
jgi:3',5'-cyclic AMP phosphodiesterase CpdA